MWLVGTFYFLIDGGGLYSLDNFIGRDLCGALRALHRRQWRRPALRACRTAWAFRRAAARARRHDEFVEQGGAAARTTLSRVALRPARLRAFGEGAPGILQRCAG